MSEAHIKFTGSVIKFTKKEQLETTLLSQGLPSELLNYFRTTEVQELCNIKTKEVLIAVKLEENNPLPNFYIPSDEES
jgi:hypothetical protein